ncbi:MAG: hypothetical protein ISS78_03990 [Phycisphaerae bacterium]|nr:hypothetical protein [Phycisphaerae bacterium]
MKDRQPEKSVEEIIEADGRYPPEAYSFLHEGLAKAVREAYAGEASGSGRHHVTGQQMCQALRDLAAQRWGMLAPTVLASWNIHGTIDFGQMVYLLIEHGFMHRSEEDSIDDFADVFDLSEAFNDVDKFELSR